MKTLRTLLASVVVILILGLAACGESLSSTDEHAVASAFGEIKAYLLSTNYPAAYEMMSAEYRKSHSLSVFRAGDGHKALTQMFAECDWTKGGDVHLNGSHAELRIKYNVSFGRSFRFVKEDGRWRFTDKTSDFESLRP